jgi:G3E family GTPase
VTVKDVPVTLVTGFLGAGKTTAILDLFAHKPPGARWAVVVNEFGKQAVDGAVLEGGGVTVREVAGGCVCCTSGIELKVALARILREVEPERLIVEPTGVARPAAILDAFAAPGLKEALSPRATIGLVDVRRIADPRFRERDGWVEQWQVADVLVGNHADEATDEQIAAFRTEAEASWPPKAVVAVTSQGRLDPAWLDLQPAQAPFRILPAHRPDDVAAAGWGWEAKAIFDVPRLQEALQRIVRPGPLLPEGALRVKGLFRTPRGWLLVNGTAETLQFRPFDHRRDSRVEVIAPPSPPPDWDAVHAAFEAARIG